MHILLTGATGFIGSALIEAFTKNGHEFSILTRDRKHVKQQVVSIYENVDEIPDDCVFDAIINLAGAPIGKRWTALYKKELMESRVNTTRDLYNLVKRLKQKPAKLISASAIGYYGNQGDNALDEESKPKQEFAHKLCDMWEQEAMRIKELGIDVVITRLGVVLGPGGGMLKQTAPIFKLGLGGRIGSGLQYLSWVHLEDVVRAMNFLLDNNIKNGVYNLTSPNPITNEHWTQALAGALNRPAWFPLPGFMVKLMFGEMGESLLLGSQKVLPSRLSKAGFKFRYAKIEEALANIFD